jgi:peptidoglycan/xylan/chitin deacetylase (PgdA/CDA1 family)
VSFAWVAVDLAIVAIAATLGRWASAGRGRFALSTAVVAAVLAGWLYTQTDQPPLIAMLAAGFGLGVGIATAGFPLGPRESPSRTTSRRRRTAVVTVALLWTMTVGAWIGANSPTATWFGPIVSHGPARGNEVALTFDDGPNVNDTLAIAHLLDAYGAKGTFFTVGKALAKRPDISRALMADGQLLGNHSYHHDQWRWLDPRYPELERTQRVFKQNLGVCPAFYRPPHGEHTPFMSWVLHNNHMTMVGWDSSGADWATTNERAVARRILKSVHPGSIIVLHDGLDGDLTADRSVVLRALPTILRGLAARGLHSVRLDTLLGVAGYGDSHC